MRISRMMTIAAGVVGCCAALTGTALADTSVTSTIGPVTIPSVPVSACVTAPGLAKCVSTPPAQTVTLQVKADVLGPTVAVTPPTVKPIPCPAGTTGAAAEITTGTAQVAVTASVVVTQNGKPPVTVPVAPAVAVPNKSVKVYACTGVS